MLELHEDRLRRKRKITIIINGGEAENMGGSTHQIRK
jgi:hypothetical protein